MWKWVILGVMGFVMYKLVASDMRRKAKARDLERAREEELQAKAGTMVRDPICGTFVPADSGIRVRDGETIHCFCSHECRDAFLARVSGGPGASA